MAGHNAPNTSTPWPWLKKALIFFGSIFILFGLWFAQHFWVIPSNLGRLIGVATRLEVYADTDKPPYNARIYASASQRDLDELRAALTVERPREFRHCMCDGDPRIRLYLGPVPLGEISIQHGLDVRCQTLWLSDAPLPDPELLFRWFDARGMTAPRKDFVRDRENDRKWKLNRENWIAAAPMALRPIDRLLGQSEADMSALRGPLAESLPDRDERILALFGWFGSSFGSWQSYPAYQSTASALLMEYPIEALASAAEKQDLTKAQTEGAARLFSGHAFYMERRKDLLLLSPKMRGRLLKYALSTGQSDKSQLAQRAFGSPAKVTLPVQQ
ncbi:hypothetical protein EPO15_14345 [bacterium]|nr:MAG: hypothetical protein EPO15_14345 [bacterium]